jgi:hypothetical protein
LRKSMDKPRGALYVALPLYDTAVTIELSMERADQVKP